MIKIHQYFSNLFSMNTINKQSAIYYDLGRKDGIIFTIPSKTNPTPSLMGKTITLISEFTNSLTHFFKSLFHTLSEKTQKSDFK